MEKVIRDKIGKVIDIEERQLLKDIVQEIFMDIAKGNQEQYQQLEERVFQELSMDPAKFTIYTAVCNRNDYDYNNGFLYPMVLEDIKSMGHDFRFRTVKDQVYDIEKIRENFEQHKEVILFDIFMECESKIIREMLDNQSNYQLEIITDQNRYITNVELSQSSKYTKPIQNIYYTFRYNNIIWRTVNNPYAYKFVDVMIKELPAIQSTEIIKEMIVHLGPYEKYQKRDMILLWNIKQISIADNNFPIPMKNSDKFEHYFSMRELGPEHGYLAHPTNQYLDSVRYDTDKLVFISSWAKAKKWEVVKIFSAINQEISWLSYGLASNQRKTSFVDRFANQNSLIVRTRGEIQRLINGFCVSDEIEYCGIEINTNNNIVEINNLNNFIEDDIRKEKDKHVMVLKFNVSKNTFVTMEQVNFLVSEIQLYFPEYCCVGNLI